MPSLEIVFLHGTMGCHLEDEATNERIWLRPQIALTDVAERLTLTPGASPIKVGPQLWPYWKATDSWRSRGLKVHPISYDWRRSVELAAHELDEHINKLASQDPSARFLLVGHSMGGVVASLWAEQTPDWDERVDGIVVLSAPLRGCMAPVAMALGQKPLALAFALFDLHDHTEELRRMTATMPGMLDLMLDPALGDAALASTFHANNWPDGVAPPQHLLDRSLALKRRLARSPALERTVAFVQLDRRTSDQITLDASGALADVVGASPGDGTVPARSMVLPGLAAAWELKDCPRLANTHMLSPRHPSFIQAVYTLAMNEAPGLPELDMNDPRLHEAPLERLRPSSPLQEL